MAEYQRRSPAVPSDRHQEELLLLRLGSRICPDHNNTSDAGPSLRRLVGGREFNAEGSRPLVHAPHSLRCNVEHVPRWIRYCRLMIHDRKGRDIKEERAQAFLAMGFFALTIIRRWRKWAHREAGMRRFFEKLSLRNAVRRWKQAARLDACQAILQRFVMRGALRCWRREIQRRVALETAAAHHSRNLVSKVWQAWVIYRSTSAFEHQRLRNVMNIWRAWHQWWKSRRRDFIRRMARRALASALGRWRLGASASRSRRQGAVYLLESLLLRKCLLALADNAFTARILRRMLESHYWRTLRDGLDAWGLFLASQDNQNKNSGAVENPTRGVATRRQRRYPGKPRKVHCRCVYAVSRGQRCTCAPRSHLLHRVEELHRLVARGLDGRDGGHRLLSHVVQRADYYDAAPRHVREGCAGEPILRPPPVSEGCGNASRDDLRRGTMDSCGRLAGGGNACFSNSTRCRSHKSRHSGTSKSASSLRMRDADSHLASATKHTLLAEEQIDELAGAVGSPAVACGPRCENRGTQPSHARRGRAPTPRQDMSRW